MIEDKNKDLDINIIKEEVIKNLQEICNNLKKIPNIGNNYIEYISALIYAIYESGYNFKQIELNDISYIVQKIDYELDIIRQKENSRRLFINIKFNEVINIDNYISFYNVITQLSKLIIMIKDIEKNGKSILAEAFEYIIMKAAQNNELPFNDTEFYTPKGVVKTMVKLLDIKNKMAIYNPACGIGNFITESAKYADIYAFGEEINISNYNICITNLWLHDIYNKRIKENNQGEIQLVDIAIANPPFASNIKENIESDSKLQEIYYNYGIMPTTSSYTKYLVMMLKNIHINGKMAIIVPHGFLFKKTNSEYIVRRELIEKNYIDAIIGLPEKLFYKTKIPVVILIIDKAKKRKEVLFIDASKEYTSKRKTNILTVKNQEKILNTYKKYETLSNYSCIVNIEQIRKNDYDLNINRYVQIQNRIEEINQKQIEMNVYKLEQEKDKIQKQITNLLRNTF